MKKILVLLISAILIGCGTSPTTTHHTPVAPAQTTLPTKTSQPIETSTKDMSNSELSRTVQVHGYGVTVPNSADGSHVRFQFTNTNPEKTIKYAKFDFSFWNAVNDQISNEIGDDVQSLNFTGPVEPDELVAVSTTDPVFYNASTYYCELEKISLEYMDGTETIIEKSDVIRLMSDNVWSSGANKEHPYSYPMDDFTQVPAEKTLVAGQDLPAGMYRVTGSSGADYYEDYGAYFKTSEQGEVSLASFNLVDRSKPIDSDLLLTSGDEISYVAIISLNSAQTFGGEMRYANEKLVYGELFLERILPTN